MRFMDALFNSSLRIPKFRFMSSPHAVAFKFFHGEQALFEL